MNKEKLNKSYKQLKENLSVILLIPTILGGLWQLLELSSISTSFIRFFSFTQLIPDGLLFLFVLTCFYISHRMIGIRINSDIFKLDMEGSPPNWLELMLFPLALVINFIILPQYKDLFVKDYSFFIFVITIPILTQLFVVTILGGKLWVVKIIKSKSSIIKKLISKSWTRDVLVLSIGIIFLFLALWILRFILLYIAPYFIDFRNRLLFPDNLLNSELVEERLIDKYKLESQPKLIYFNDKYFFYELIYKENEKQILIIDFADLTKENPPAPQSILTLQAN